MWELGVILAGYGVMLYLMAKAHAMTTIAEAKADAIRRKADYELKEKDDAKEAKAKDDLKRYQDSVRGELRGR